MHTEKEGRMEGKNKEGRKGGRVEGREEKGGQFTWEKEDWVTLGLLKFKSGIITWQNGTKKGRYLLRMQLTCIYVLSRGGKHLYMWKLEYTLKS